MPWRTDLLEPIPGDNPGGADLRYDPVYDEIKEARREDDEAPQGQWAHERKVADWGVVVRLAGDALAKKTKDLQLAAFLTEAMLRREGVSGLKGGLDLFTGLLTKFWDHLYPEPDEGDLEPRAGPLQWIGDKLDPSIKLVPLNQAGHSWVNHAQMRTFPTEAEAGRDTKKIEARKKAIEAGKIPTEVWESSCEQTPKAFYKQLVKDIDGSLAAIKTLDKLCDDKFGDVAPSFSGLRKSLEEIRQLAGPILTRKLELDPDPPEEIAPEPEPEAAAEGGDAAAAGDAAASGAPGALSIEPKDRYDAVSRLLQCAKFMRKTEPGNPASYLAVRAFRWGELRTNGFPASPKLLESPPPAVRTHLKGLLLDKRWPELLSAAEDAAGLPCGRAWLDLQRYAITALDHLGPEYQAVGKAVRGALLQFLREYPQLVEAAMMDDTPTANLETQEWLRRENEMAHASQNGDATWESGDEGDENMQAERVFQLAMDAVRSGNPEQGIGLLTRDLAGERSARGRFRRKTQLARVLVESGREAIAQPILQELVAQIDAHKLEEWESGEIVAEPLALLHKCLTKLNGDAATKQALYLRICRLDPVQAIGCGV